ncbi:UDP-N-acetylmuramoylalanine--D-glutamate ligase [Candidatus Nomurabacteria bacterium RIFCSPHIGHO2_02_FULL_41_18]|uniref:UDP-N-acetylmuramoylalanine--D-glutamate ligase n=1 Tax=Candidatus Nomurabacteria bacterium RIFCSPHIGHO2_02_FULL_41_18 TaxID=1801754 RepID=A0A1F6W7W7_9BACT|nr:MAG: UDP-N-acetylmuramoylalanine--D-glutamate ligase [Candidatus Nomurabacteria bacterium RIFCSPHIGHO2_01_FULL_41_71]OGI77892.1 MAG: UDP-N-acetylmuramoylalanine--D-glutamate ligase [Candidatus Nomurabacteria bacterium RIFCSPHIGHO2_02_FULL_41_18]OGI90066.1 MAG: UDP-N-acetylmuramoylalanine--D-glutamate ligase [Candidatus Nomurabacteria bacterium RIFCSPLOWO2_01_FULL_41_52b]OGJ00181.1 MAG: UDP-N-acetylmuramoylalanine--D-glutamate ligase [Candidatus Nomurabacteria bacterium RIFCSPLOWO2_02_FULL_41_
MEEYKKFFKNKKVTVMGLGLLGRGVGDAIFLAECGAKLTITDLKTKEQLKESLQKLKKFQNSANGASIKYVLGKHRLEDFRNCDMILKAAGVPLDSPYIKEAKKNKIPVEMSATIFAKFSGISMIGITGTRGKSTVTHLIARILEKTGRKVILGGNVRGVSNLQLLKKTQGADIAVFELDSWQLQGFNEAKISPEISIFTNFMPDHMNYYNNDLKKYFTDKSYIYKFQKNKNILIVGSQMKNLVKNTKSQVLNADSKNIPKSWKIGLLGKHNLENIACVFEAAKVLKIPENIIKKTVENFKAVEGRLELVKNIKGIKIYNDTNSTTPDAVLAALRSFPQKVILIMGGMDKNLSVDSLIRILPKKTKMIFLTPGSGSDKIKTGKAKIKKVSGLKEAMTEAVRKSTTGDIILFSPGFTSFNMFNNEYDRGDKFMKIIKNLNLRNLGVRHL